MEQISAAQASAKPAVGGSSIAGVVEHLRFSVAFINSHCRGEKPNSDWKSSWRIQEVSESQWSELQVKLRSEYDELMRFLAGEPELEADALTGTLATLPHMAYHLGAIRRLASEYLAGDTGW